MHHLPITGYIPEISTCQNTSDAAKTIGKNRSWLLKQLREGFFTDGIHTVKGASSQRFWFMPLVLDRIQNIDDDAAHQRAIARWQERLPSNWPAAKTPKNIEISA